jgi:hypothetical protein
MDLRRLRAGEWIAALGGGLLLLSLFLAWYELPVPSVAAPARSEAVTAWEAFAVNDVLLAIVAGAALSVVPVTAGHRVPAVPLALETLVAIAGKVALVLVLIRMVSRPDGATGLELGAWLGLLGAAVVVVGGWTAMRDERLSGEGTPTDLTGRPWSEPPPIETLPAP